MHTRHTRAAVAALTTAGLVAGAIGWVIARSGLQPIQRLTDAVIRVTDYRPGPDGAFPPAGDGT